VQRPESSLRTGVEGVGRVRRRGRTGGGALPGQKRQAVRGAMREPMIPFEHRHDLGVLGQARRVDDREPVVEGLAVSDLDVADLGLQRSVDVHQASPAGVSAASRAERFRSLTHVPIDPRRCDDPLSPRPIGRGYWRALQPSLVRTERADRALVTRSPTRTHADERLSECSMIKPFIDLGGEAIQLLTTALGRLLLGVDEPDPQTRRPGISNLPPVPLSASLELVTGDEAGRLGNRGGFIRPRPYGLGRARTDDLGGCTPASQRRCLDDAGSGWPRAGSVTVAIDRENTLGVFSRL
jgi:hypothetical protein